MSDDEHVRRNARYWDAQAPDWVDSGRRAWAQEQITWGMWEVPESEIQALPDVSGMDVIELGCGTGYVGAWLARRGARVTGVDASEQQLATARMLQTEHGLEFPLIHGNAEAVPLPDGSFDLAVSEYGAAIWCDPYRWIPEAARLLRPGGWLVFLGNSVLVMMCTPDSDSEPAGTELLRDQFGMHRFEWSDDESVEFHISHGAMIDLLRANGLSVERLIEVRAPDGASSRHIYVTAEWARRWPSEEIWVARKR